MLGSRQKAFSVVSIETGKIVVHSGAYNIPLDEQCFDALEKTYHENPILGFA